MVTRRLISRSIDIAKWPGVGAIGTKRGEATLRAPLPTAYPAARTSIADPDQDLLVDEPNVSIGLGHEIPALQRNLVIEFSVVRPLRQLDLRRRHFLVWDRAQDMRDAVEARPPLVVGAHDMPRRVLAVGRLQHHIAGLRIGVPAPERFDVHRAQFPLPQRIVDARLEPALLLLLADLQPHLDQDDATVDDIFFHLRAQVEKTAMLGLAAKAHDVFDAGAVVPAAVEDDDLAGGRETLHVALH